MSHPSCWILSAIERWISIAAGKTANKLPLGNIRLEMEFTYDSIEDLNQAIHKIADLPLKGIILTPSQKNGDGSWEIITPRSLVPEPK